MTFTDRLIYGKCEVLNPYTKELEIIDYCFLSYDGPDINDAKLMYNRIFRQDAINFAQQKYLQTLDEEQPIIIENIKIPNISKIDFKKQIKMDIMKQWEEIIKEN